MKTRAAILALAAFVSVSGWAADSGSTVDDPFLWLEDIESPRALEWVAFQNAATAQRLTNSPVYAPLYREALSVLDSASRIPEVNQRGKWLYNFWRDSSNPR